ncbi:S1 RNA-binding domain-containing protein [uncultured Hyphomonas sp.]|uniref:S1 RNA-binding domain-containing protein n=1 Tax=uncultured Hyphomonas sp. TaxID=225298 RepID=UPI0030D95EEF
MHAITDLDPGMKLEGVVTNVTAFGAFVDIGVHQDGLVHISQLSDRFVDSPRDVVKAGDVVQVRVLDVDLEQKRISLSMKSPADAVASPVSRKSPSAPARKAGKLAAQPHTSSPFDVLKALKP